MRRTFRPLDMRTYVRHNCRVVYSYISKARTEYLVLVWYTRTALPFLNRGVSSIDVTGKFELRV